MVTRDEARGYALLLAALSQGRGLRFAKSGQRKALPYWSLLEPYTERSINYPKIRQKILSGRYNNLAATALYVRRRVAGYGR